MSNILNNVLTNEDLLYINQLPEVIAAKNKLNLDINYSVAYFTINPTESMKTTLNTKFGIDLEQLKEIPMRWIKGDTLPHIDKGQTYFTTTYLTYINNSVGQFVVNNIPYEITANTAFIFNEGLLHETINTNNEPRLLLGPFNEYAHPVGLPPVISYFNNEADALTNNNAIGYDYSYTVGANGPFGSYTHWRIASNSTGLSDQNIIYDNGMSLNPSSGSGDAYYFLYPVITCLLEGTKVLTLKNNKETYLEIEKLEKGDLVKTNISGWKRIEVIGYGDIYNYNDNKRIENRLYECTCENYPELTENLYLTGCHSLLIDKLTDHNNIIAKMGRIFITEQKYRLPVYLDNKAKPWTKNGIFKIWHLALENNDKKMNYGIFVNGGLLVESCSIYSITTRSNLSLK
jgi:hypothetical protein